MSVGCQVGNSFVDSSAKQGCQDYQFASVCFLYRESNMSAVRLAIFLHLQVQSMLIICQIFLDSKTICTQNSYDPCWGNQLNFSWSDT